MNVFVYGTLKRGEWNHRLLAHARFVTVGTVPDVALIAPRSFPYAFERRRSRVQGEVFEIDETILQQLDRLEGVSYGHYTRQLRPVQTGQGVLMAWMYLATPETLRGLALTPILSIWTGSSTINPQHSTFRCA